MIRLKEAHSDRNLLIFGNILNKESIRLMKKKSVAGFIALFLGTFGAHRFYLGQRVLGIFHFIFAIVTFVISIEAELPFIAIPALMGFIDAVLFFAMPKSEFDEKYNYSKKGSRRRRDWNRYYEDKPYSAPPLSFRELKRQGIEDFRKHRYEDAAYHFEEALEMAPDDPSLHFNLACTYSILRDSKQAFYHLEQAVAFGFDKIDKIHQHDALAFLRAQPVFDDFVDNGYRLPPQQLPAPQPNLLEDSPSAANKDILEQIVELGKLRDQGILTQEEFTRQKQKLLREE